MDFRARSENGCEKLDFLVCNTVRIGRTGRHTPTNNPQEYPPGGGHPSRRAIFIFLMETVRHVL